MKKWIAGVIAGLVASMFVSAPAQAATEWDFAPSVMTSMPKPPSVVNAKMAASKGVSAPKGLPPVIDKSGKVVRAAKSTNSLLTGPYYLYNVGSQEYTAEGIATNVEVGQPYLNTAGGDFHSLAEISVQDANNNIIEMGWTVNPAVNGGSLLPHLFVFSWVNGVPGTYNGSGFVRIPGACDKVGTALAVGSAEKMLIQTYNNAWWFGYGSCWVGYFPFSKWSNNFQQGTIFQTFQEIAANEQFPCTDMGNGYPGNNVSPTGARLSSTLFLTAAGTTPANYPSTDVDLYVRATPTPDADTPYYVPNKLSGRSMRGGGAGYNPAGTALGTRNAC